MTGFRPGTLDRIEADDALLACSSLRRIDHVDAHLLRIDRSPTGTPEEWAREILEHTSVRVRMRLCTGWSALGIALHHGRHDTIAGWPITANTAEYIRLQGDSRVGLTGQLVTRVSDEGVTFATFVRLGNPVARMIWAKVLPTHLAIVRSLVEAAADRVRARCPRWPR